MGLFRKNYIKMLEAMSEAEKAELTNEWEYVLFGYCVVNRSKLEKTVEIGKILTDLCQYYAMSPLIDERTARKIGVDFGIACLSKHTGTGFTVQEYKQSSDQTSNWPNHPDTL